MEGRDPTWVDRGTFSSCPSSSRHQHRHHSCLQDYGTRSVRGSAVRGESVWCTSSCGCTGVSVFINFPPLTILASFQVIITSVTGEDKTRHSSTEHSRTCTQKAVSFTSIGISIISISISVSIGVSIDRTKNHQKRSTSLHITASSFIHPFSLIHPSLLLHSTVG